MILNKKFKKAAFLSDIPANQVPLRKYAMSRRKLREDRVALMMQSAKADTPIAASAANKRKDKSVSVVRNAEGDEDDDDEGKISLQ